MYISSTFFFDVHVGQNFQHYTNYGENNNACYFSLSKMRNRIRVGLIHASWHDFFFSVYTSITFRTRGGRPKIRFGLGFAFFVHKKIVSTCHLKHRFQNTQRTKNIRSRVANFFFDVHIHYFSDYPPFSKILIMAKSPLGAIPDKFLFSVRYGF